MWSIHDALCLLLLMLFSFSIGSHMQEAVLHKLLQCWTALWAAALHEFLWSESLPLGAVLQEPAAPACVPFWATNPARKLSPPWALHGLLLCPGYIYLLQCETLHGLQSDSLCHHSPPQGLQRNISSDSCITMSPSYFTNPVSAQ